MNAPISVFPPGTTIRLTAEIKDAAGALTDTTVTCSVLPPGGTQESASVTRDSVGRYRADYTPTARGLHRYKFVGTSPAAVTASGQFLVSPVPF